MMRAWIAVALLAGSWLFSLGYFDPPSAVAWACTLFAAVLLLAGTPVRLPGLPQRIVILLLLTPAVWLVPYPYKGMFVLLLFGVVASLFALRAPWLRGAAHGSILAAVILVAQALTLAWYQSATARAHELPHACAQGFVAFMGCLGADITLDAATIVLRYASTTIRVAATWELLLAPGTACFLAGGCLLLILVSAQHRDRWTSILRYLLALVALGTIWSPVRAALLTSVVLQQQLRATAITYPNVGETLISTWVHVALLIVLAAVAGLILRPSWTSTVARLPRRPSVVRQGSVAVACMLGIALLTSLYYWVPVGQRKAGRVMFVERHSTWEPTTEPYGTKVYGEAGSYNYAAIYEYAGQYYEMSRLLDESAIDNTALQQCDVLIIKTPTSRYSPDEVAAVVQFVERGGSLLLIGDHTNVFNMSTYLNDVARHFGFTFRNDLLFRIGDPYRQLYQPPRIRHPMLQYMPAMNFAVSCSIDPGDSQGTMVIHNVGLYNLPSAYHESNYHPQAEYRPNMQYGCWCQLWATTFGRGRVAAFADSTLFSNFCTFQPGKAELFIGMLEWLNHTSSFDAQASRRAKTLGMICLGVGLVLLCSYALRGLRGSWLLVLSAGAAGWSVAGWVVMDCQRQAMPLPAKQARMPHVVIDRTVSTVPLFTGAFADDPEGNGYGMLEQWIPRLGNYTSRRAELDAMSGDALVLICPSRLPGQSYREELVAWVRSGGRLVVLDSPDVAASTANSILMLFGLSSSPGAPKPAGDEQPARMADGSAQTPISMSCTIGGGSAVATWGDSTVAAQTTFGQGRVTAIGFGSLFNDANMGYHWLAEPDDDLLQRYEMLYALLRSALQD